MLLGGLGGFLVVPMNALLQHRGHNLMGAGRSIAVQNFNEQACILGLGALYSFSTAAGVSAFVAITLFGLVVAGFMGLMLQLAIVGGLAYLLISWLRRRSQRQLAAAGAGPEGSFRTAEFELAGSRDAAVPALPAAVQLGDADYETFTAMLTEIQRAWSRGDMNAAAGWLSDDMQAHFTGLLAEDKAAGRRNVVSDVVLLKGALGESWREDGAEWATVEMRWQALDYTVDAKDGQVIEGSALDPVEASERWTLVRRAGEGWKLAGIDQA